MDELWATVTSCDPLKPTLAGAAWLADALGIGLLALEPPRALNRRMEALVRQWGLQSFLHPGPRVFTDDRRGKRQRMKLVCISIADRGVMAAIPQLGFIPLPERGIHPFYRLDAHGRIGEANTAGREFMEIVGEQELATRLGAAMRSTPQGEGRVDLAQGPHVFSFVVAQVEHDTWHAYGSDETGRRYAEISLRQAKEEIACLNGQLEQHVAQLTGLNRELEAFSYSVSHDLRGPLRAIDGFSAILAEDHGERLDEQGRDCLARIRNATARMADLIEGLLRLAQISRAQIQRESVELSALAHAVAEELHRDGPPRAVDWQIADGLCASADRALMTVLMENLLGNAWKFTTCRHPARIEFGAGERQGSRCYYVRDNGVGFDMAYLGRLFQPFERLHGHEFAGTGIGLATVQRIVMRHGGSLWAESREGEGAAFYFTLGE